MEMAVRVVAGVGDPVALGEVNLVIVGVMVIIP